MFCVSVECWVMCTSENFTLLFDLAFGKRKQIEDKSDSEQSGETNLIHTGAHDLRQLP